MHIGHRAADLHRGVVDESEREGCVELLGQRKRRRHRWDRCGEPGFDVFIGDTVDRA